MKILKRFELMDILEEIQIKNNKENIGTNEAELSTREDIADLFFKLLNEANADNASDEREGCTHPIYNIFTCAFGERQCKDCEYYVQTGNCV